MGVVAAGEVGSLQAQAVLRLLVLTVRPQVEVEQHQGQAQGGTSTSQGVKVEEEPQARVVLVALSVVVGVVLLPIPLLPQDCLEVLDGGPRQGTETVQAVNVLATAVVLRVAILKSTSLVLRQEAQLW